VIIDLAAEKEEELIHMENTLEAISTFQFGRIT